MPEVLKQSGPETPKENLWEILVGHWENGINDLTTFLETLSEQKLQSCLEDLQNRRQFLEKEGADYNFSMVTRLNRIRGAVEERIRDLMKLKQSGQSKKEK